MSDPTPFPRAPVSNWAGVAQLGLLATIAGLFLVTGLNAHLSEPPPKPSRVVPVAARDLPTGTLLTREELPELVPIRRATEVAPPPRPRFEQ